MRVVGLDLSLTSTGVALIKDGGFAVVDRITSKPKGSDLIARWERLYFLRQAIFQEVHGADLVVVEGLAYGSVSPHATERAGLWWFAVDYPLRHDQLVAVVPPACRAKYATGKGNAGKDAVLAAVVRRYPDVAVEGNDEADALVLAAMGARWLGHPIDDVPAAHLTALDKCLWPEREEAG